MRTLLRYYGGKSSMVGAILPLIEPHTLYCEPFFGGGSVFFAKEPSKMEVINDTNRRMVAFYRVAQTRAEELVAAIRSTLYSRSLCEDAYVIYHHPHLFDELKLAWAVWVLSRMSFNGNFEGGYTFSRVGTLLDSSAALRKSLDPAEISSRFDRVEIESRDALKIIEQRDSPETFFYVDPPYVGADQGHYDGYSQADFDSLLDTLEGIKGKFLLSSYSNPSLSGRGWTSTELDRQLSAANAAKCRPRRKTEVLTRNY